MSTLHSLHKRPSKEDQRLAASSLNALESALTHAKGKNVPIQVAETGEPIVLPQAALSLLYKVLEAMAEGKPVAITPLALELTTQKAAEIIGCSRPHLVKLLEEGKIRYTHVGRHRRVRYEDLMTYQREQRDKQRKILVKMMQEDEEDGLYDS